LVKRRPRKPPTILDRPVTSEGQPSNETTLRAMVKLRMAPSELLREFVVKEALLREGGNRTAAKKVLVEQERVRNAMRA
jgi:hypothetical protein